MGLAVVADTSAVLSLALSGLFRICQRHFRIIIGERVAEELREISSRDDELGKAAKEVLKEIVEITSVGKKFSKGEDEALRLLAETKADLLISDDIEFVKKHRRSERISFSVILFGFYWRRKL